MRKRKVKESEKSGNDLIVCNVIPSLDSDSICGQPAIYIFRDPATKLLITSCQQHWDNLSLHAVKYQ